MLIAAGIVIGLLMLFAAGAARASGRADDRDAATWEGFTRRWNEQDAAHGDVIVLPSVDAPPADNAAPGSGLGRLNRAGVAGVRLPRSHRSLGNTK